MKHTNAAEGISAQEPIFDNKANTLSSVLYKVADVRNRTSFSLKSAAIKKANALTAEYGNLVVLFRNGQYQIGFDMPHIRQCSDFEKHCVYATSNKPN